MQEVSVSGAGAGAESAGGGAVQIKFVTRSGTNQYDTSIYHYFRHPSLNTNYFFNKVNGLDQNRVIVHTYGGRVGGPIVIPGVVDGRGKAFFFSNFEHFYQPTEITRTRTILTPEAQTGVFQWTTTALGLQPVNLLALAAANGQIVDHRSDDRGAPREDPHGDGDDRQHHRDIPNTFNTLAYIYQAAVDAATRTRRPTASTSTSPTAPAEGHLLPPAVQERARHAERRRSAVPRVRSTSATRTSWRTTGSVTLRSTLGSGLVNEAHRRLAELAERVRPQHQPGACSRTRPDSRSDFPLVTGATTRTSSAPRNTPNWNIDNNVSWLKGGAQLHVRRVVPAGDAQPARRRNAVPTVNLGFDTTNDPARAMFTTANFPGASNDQLGEARSALRAPHRPRDADHRHGAAQRRGRPSTSTSATCSSATG